MARTYRGLLVWQKAMELVEATYRLSRRLPGIEKFGLVTQLQRAAVSVPANIAEGHERQSRKEFTRFLAIAKGSLAELETLFELCQRLDYFDETALLNARTTGDEVGRMLTAMYKTLTAPHVSEQDSDEVPDAALL